MAAMLFWREILRIADKELLLLKTDISLKNKYIYDVLEIR